MQPRRNWTTRPRKCSEKDALKKIYVSEKDALLAFASLK